MPSEASFHRIRRAKSTPAVQNRRHAAPKPLESEVDRYHATTAASLAMAQAKDRMMLPPPPLPKDSAYSVDNPPALPPSRPQNYRNAFHSLRGESLSGLSSRTISDTRCSDLKIGTNAENDAHSYKLSSPELEEFGLNEDLSAPSSFRRLRKSRSMLTAKSLRNIRAAGIAASSSEEADSPSMRKSIDSATGTQRGLRHSFSFWNSASLSLRKMKSHSNLSMRKQRSSVCDTEIPVPEIPLSAKVGDQPARKPMRTTVRPPRRASLEDPPFSTTSHSKQSKSRTFTISLKKRLKKVFGFSGDEKTEVLAHRGPSYEQQNTALQSPTLTDETFRPSLCSSRSSESLATSASRVTSWTDSTVANTIKTRHTIGHPSLSTIEEGYDSPGKSFPSHTARCTDADEYYEDANRRGKQIDSQRVYSALMRHIGETAARDGDRIISTGAVKGSPVIMECSPSIPSLGHRHSVHKVPSDLSMKTARTSIVVEHGCSSSQSPLPLRLKGDEIEDLSTTHETRHDMLPSPRSPRLARHRDSSSLRPSSGSSPRLKTPSPYKASMTSISELSDDIMSAIGPSTKGIYQVKPVELESPSIYSRTPSGAAGSRDELEITFEETFEPGTATIYDAPVVYQSPRKRGSQPLDIGPKSSADWRRWMSSQLDECDVHENSEYIKREHVWEDAECDEDWNEKSIDSAKGESHRHLQHTYSSLQDRATDTRSHGPNNFSRPISRQSMGSLRLTAQSSAGYKLQQPARGVEIDSLGVQKRLDDDPFVNDPQESPCSDSISPSHRRAIRAAREARLSRGMRRNTLRQTVDQKDAKAVEFRSIRQGSNTSTNNLENERGTIFREKYKAGEPVCKMDGNRLVEDFLNSRRGRPIPDADESVFL